MRAKYYMRQPKGLYMALNTLVQQFVENEVVE
jgi:hypothetical protein